MVEKAFRIIFSGGCDVRSGLVLMALSMYSDRIIKVVPHGIYDASKNQGHMCWDCYNLIGIKDSDSTVHPQDVNALVISEK